MMKDYLKLDEAVMDLTYVNSDLVAPLFYVNTAFEKDKEVKNFIKYVERLVRSSREYKQLIKYIREELEIKNCGIFKNVSYKEALLECHHMPFTLFDIVETILNERLENGKPVTPFSIAEEVCLLHYQGAIGLVYVSKTIHDLYHSRKIDIPADQIIGEPERFFNKFQGYFSENALLKYELFKNGGGMDRDAIVKILFENPDQTEADDRLTMAQAFVKGNNNDSE